MSDTLTESVARLYRAGLEYSQQTKKLREATDMILSWLKDNLPGGFELPLHCDIWPSGEFVQYYDETKTQGVFKITLRQEHSRHDLLHFSKLIADGFLDKLSEKLEVEARKFEDTAEQVDSFLLANKK
jgi:hypothetical protein